MYTRKAISYKRARESERERERARENAPRHLRFLAFFITAALIDTDWPSTGDLGCQLPEEGLGDISVP